jgi:hypothetical protein
MLTAVATIAYGQTVGSDYKLTHQTLATSSPDSVRTIRGILANHDARKLSEWNQGTVKLYQQNYITLLGRGTTIVVDKVDTVGDMLQFHLKGSRYARPLFAPLVANQLVR